MGILVNRPEFGRQTGALMDELMSPGNAWELKLGEGGNLVWESADGTLTRQPSQTFWRRIQSGFFGLFPVEQHR